VSFMARLRIAEVEALELFQVLDEDSSGDVSLEEFREALRAVAPETSLKGFWQRLVAEWPEVAKAARDCAKPSLGQTARRHLGELLAELLPEELRVRFEAPQVASTIPQPSPVLKTLSLEVFDALAANLDVSRANANQIFAWIATAVSSRRQQSEEASEHTEAEGELPAEIYIEDFAEQLKIWTDNSWDAQGQTPGGALHDIQQAVAPARATIAALKQELLPPAEARQCDNSQAVPQTIPKPQKHRPRVPKLPWRTYYSQGGLRLRSW